MVIDIKLVCMLQLALRIIININMCFCQKLYCAQSTSRAGLQVQTFQYQNKPPVIQTNEFYNFIVKFKSITNNKELKLFEYFLRNTVHISPGSKTTSQS